jgi:dTDP-4-dehydrorhamnose 3,5-epimerase
MIKDVLIDPLKVIADDRGAVMHMIRSDAPYFKQFGEVYFSIVNAGVVKGWKLHKEQTQFFAVPSGNIKLVLMDYREGSDTFKEIQEIIIGEDDYKLVKIPVGVIYGFQSLNNQKAMIANCADIPHSKGEAQAFDLNDSNIPYVWCT